MTVYIKLTIAGEDVGPCSLYSDVNGFVTAFETGISRQSLVDGFLSTNAPDGTFQVKVVSTGSCTNYVIITISTNLTTTSTTTLTPTTTTTTTLVPTTTTTTTAAETFYRVTQCPPLSANFTLAKTMVAIAGQNVVFNTSPPDGNNYCGQVIDENFSTGPATGTLVSVIDYPCNDVIHCYQAV